MSWDDVAEKFRHLTHDVIDEKVQSQVIETIADLENQGGTSSRAIPVSGALERDWVGVEYMQESWVESYEPERQRAREEITRLKR